MKVIIYPDVDIWNFVLSSLNKREDILLIPLNRYCNFFQKVVRKINFQTTVPSWSVIGKKLLQKLSSLKLGDSVVLCEYSESSLIFALSKEIPTGVSRNLWLWNHQSSSPLVSYKLQLIHECGFQISTYDECNAQSFNLRWHPQFFPICWVQQNYSASQPNKIDFFFAGYQKNRETEITTLDKVLSNYRNHFVIVQNTKEYIPYSEYLKHAIQSRCIVEIVKTGDPACTLRPLEAIALHRKLLTNNSHIRQYSFYHPDNIFIYGEDDLTQLPAFLQSPFHSLSEDIISAYDINSWVDSFE